MKIVNIDEIKKPVVLTIGSFDGIHIGHQILLSKIIEKADEYKTKSVLLTFHPHPRKIINPDYKMKLLTTFEERKEVLEQMGFDYLVLLEFTKEIASLSPKEFYEKIILKNLNLKHVVIGFNHHFGKDRKGDYNFLHNLGSKYDFTIDYVLPQKKDEVIISSSLIRNHLEKGEIELANQMLGREYFLKSIVIHGKKMGRKLGFPTINLAIENREKILPSPGVYLTKVRHEETIKFSMTNIGTCPTFEGEKLTVESHIFDFDKDIYDEEVNLCFLKKIRNEKKFSSVKNLGNQLEIDKEKCLKIIKENFR